MAADVNVILTGLLLQDINPREKIKFEGLWLLKKLWKDETNVYYLEQDHNWVHEDQSLETSLHYKF